MASELQNLNDIFNNRVFRVPDYQRGYSWGGDQLEDFWRDLDGLTGQRNHYTGQLTLEEVPVEVWENWDGDNWLIAGKGYKPFYLVDGQQRLTTALILIKCLLEKIPEDGQLTLTEKRDHVKKFLFEKASVNRGYIFGYEKDNPSYDYFKTQILDQPENAFQGTETAYTANLWAAQDFFRKKLKDAPIGTLERWYKALTQRFRFNVYELADELDVFVVFETMNNRGKPLSRLELLKNRLIYLSTLMPTPVEEVDRQALRRNVNEAWKTVFEFLGRQKDQALDDDDFLRAHWIICFTYKREKPGQYAKFLLGEHFTPPRVINGELGITDLQRYVTSVQDSARKWHALHFPAATVNLGPGVQRGLERLARLGRGASRPLILASMQRSRDDLELTGLLAVAERFVFTIARLCQRRSNIGDTRFYRLAGRVYRDERTVASAADSIQRTTNKLFSTSRASTVMRDLFKDANGFYSWSGLRYFLFEYEQHLKERAGMGAIRLHWDEFITSKQDHETIEHIYPCSPVQGDWPEFDPRSERERAILRHSLGNLLALSQSRNSRLSNRAFAVKKQDAGGIRGYFNGSYSEIAVAKYSAWTPESVLGRGLVMLEFLETRWQVSLGHRADKVRLLNLEFMEPAP